MVGDTGCCGYHYREKSPNLFGLLTLSMPMIILGCVVFLILFAISSMMPGLKRTNKKILIIIKANLHLIHGASFYPRLRCSLAGGMFSHSPRISGAVYRNFNLSLLVLLWIIIICLGVFIAS